MPFSLAAQELEHLDQAAVDESLVALTANCLDSRKVTIYGGTNEVQRNLIARATLENITGFRVEGSQTWRHDWFVKNR